jgi:hypothetical protein
MTWIEAFTEVGSQILGNTNPTIPSNLASNNQDLHVGAVHHVWSWRALSKVVERILQENRRP